MDDLISRKKVLDVLNELDLPDVHAALPVSLMLGIVKKTLEPVPSVPAVPLEPLCEWLGKQGMLAPCYFDQKCDKCELKPYWQNKKSECWRFVLNKWMEG